MFLTEKKKYESVDRRQCIPNRQFKILFENEDVEEAYDILLENCCRVCDKSPLFDTFHQLETHMKRSHSVFACDLCVSHLKVCLDSSPFNFMGDEVGFYFERNSLMDF